MGRTKNKWGDFLDKLPKWEGERDEKRWVKLQAAKSRIQSLGLDHEDLAAIIRARREEKSRLEEFVKDISIEIDAASQILTDKMTEMGVSSFTLSDGGDMAYMAPEPHASVEDRAAVRKWAVAEGLEDLLQVPWQTLNAMLKDKLVAALEAGESVEELIPGVKAYIDFKVRVRKG